MIRLRNKYHRTSAMLTVFVVVAAAYLMERVA